MPHIVLKSFKEFPTPKKVDDFEFLWFAKPLKRAKDILVGVRLEDRYFLLEVHKKEDKFILKSDKITRISPLFLVKKALKSFCLAAECEELYDNLSSIKPSCANSAKSALKDIEFFINSFPTSKEVWIEIGFGSARHLIYQAKKNPNIQFIGIEIHKPSIEQVLKQIALQNIDNLLVIDYDARLFLEFVPSNIVGKIFVHFPVPWDKKPHRRVISKSFIKEAKRVLKKWGVLELRTDSKAYFDYALELFLQEDKVDLEVTKNMDKEIRSKYEERWIRLNKDIYDIRMKNIELSEDINLEFDFKFSKIDIEKIVKNFDEKPKVYEDFFIHFEKLYKINDTSLLLELSFGSFDRPEHRYILFNGSEAAYFPKPPVASRANIKAHKKIEELLNG